MSRISVNGDTSEEFVRYSYSKMLPLERECTNVEELSLEMKIC